MCLLGKNGAGKSTLFKILVDEESKSLGDCFLHQNDQDSVFYTYCPQTDNLDKNMTPAELITFLCNIYGYNEEATKIVYL